MTSAHFVEFFSPGTLVSESTVKPIDSWDAQVALTLVKGITERHGAKPYGFQFVTRSRGEADLDSREVARSPMHYFGVKVETLAEVEARATKNDAILLTNMRVNGYTRIVTTTRGWRFSAPLRDGDVVLDGAGL
jgi:hypothetical protein